MTTKPKYIYTVNPNIISFDSSFIIHNLDNVCQEAKDWLSDFEKKYKINFRTRDFYTCYSKYGITIGADIVNGKEIIRVDLMNPFGQAFEDMVDNAHFRAKLKLLD